jgi:glycosyltransferase involved in cell wall biosynthesis
MSAGLIPIVSKYCGFAPEEFIFEMDDLSPDGLNATINKVLGLDDVAYMEYSEAVKRYARDNFSQENVKKELIKIFRSEFP